MNFQNLCLLLDCEGGLWASWLTAVGTVLAVIVAVAGNALKNFINKPKIEISYKGNKSPCNEIVEKTIEDSQETSKSMIIRVQIVNKGRSVADDFVVCVDSYYTKGDDDKYRKEVFTPIYMTDCYKQCPHQIVPNISYYYDIVSIQDSNEESIDEDDTHKKVDEDEYGYNVYLLGSKNNDNLTNKILSKGIFIIPIKFFSSTLNIHGVQYLRVYWNSVNFTTEDKRFHIEMMLLGDFEKLEKYE